MNRRDKDVLLALSKTGYSGQRSLADDISCSLGAVNISVNNLLSEGYIDDGKSLTEKSLELLARSAPQRAVLLAAGFGIRMFPGNTVRPKALLEVRGETLVERIIRQLHEIGVYEIYVVVGFAKEQFEYLIDEYGVELVVNSEYARKNNLHSMALVREHLHNCYVVPCDMWCRTNPFNASELYSWYMVTSALRLESSVRVNRKQELAVISPEAAGNNMIGISYLLGEDAEKIRDRLDVMDKERRYEGSFWEETLYEGDKLLIGSRVWSDAVEINTVEELWELDSPSGIPLSEIAAALGVRECEITDVAVLKKGTTNRSFLFTCRGERYILRIALDDRNILVDHGKEADVYELISHCDISDEVIYINRDTGVKISRYMDNIRFCDKHSESDVRACMAKLRQFHERHITASYEFDLFETIDYFERLWEGAPSVYRDYAETKANVVSLREYIYSQPRDRCLIHIDAVPDNFCMTDGGIRLIDWEYAAVQDPHMDIAMFALYSMYKRKEVDSLISAYFPEGCSDAVRLKIYCYISAGGLLWSNWCEYKQKSGTEFGEYSLRQYRYAKEYYRIVSNELKGGDHNVQG